MDQHKKYKNIQTKNVRNKNKKLRVIRIDELQRSRWHDEL